MAEIMPIIHVQDAVPVLRFYCDGLGFTESFSMPDDSGKIVHTGVTFETMTLMIGATDNGSPPVGGGSGVVLYF